MISVIVPVYQAEKYIERCVASILSQTFTDFELVLVNDGSSDQSGMLCEQLAIIDSRIRVIHQKNQGANKARRNGWRIAKGEWITFVDSDDYIPETALEHLLAKADNNTDIIIGWMNTFQTQDEEISIDMYRSRCIGCYAIDVGPCAHLFRNILYDDSVFDIPRELTVGEDNLMNIRLAFRTEKPVRFVHEVVYVYDMTNEGSVLHIFHQTVDYEELFHQHRLASIPQANHLRYTQDLLGIRVYRLLCIIKAGFWRRAWTKSNFGKNVRDDIMKIKYPLNKATRCLLLSKNRFTQCFWVMYARLIKTYLQRKCT